MEILKMKHVSFQYPGENNDVLNNLSMQVKEGEFLVICGASGSGKTTLLKLFKNELAPYGERSGEIFYFNKLLNNWDERTLMKDIGFVFQDPENQIVMDDVLQEIVFGLENLGFSQFEMRKSVAEMVHFFGMENLLKEKPSNLSGGQKQMVNLLSILLLRPKVLLLDEPTSQLDPLAAKDLIQLLERLNSEMGMTIIIVEHRLEELFAMADRVVMLEEGKIVYEGNSREVIHTIFKKKDKLFLDYLPSVSRLYLETEQKLVKQHIPLDVKESRNWLRSITPVMKKQQHIMNLHEPEEEAILSVDQVFFQYTRQSPMVLYNLSLQIRKGEFFALVGGNGSGKTTLIKLCMGILKAQRGSVKYEGSSIHKYNSKEISEKFAYLPQNPEAYFIQDTIKREMLAMIKQHQIPSGEEKISEICELFNIEHLLQRHPHDLSGGELQRAALACMLLNKPNILFLDEPTKGLDPISKNRLAQLLTNLQQEGLTIFMVTHDIEFAVQHIDRCAIIFDGQISAEGDRDKFFKGNYFYTTALNRATRNSQMPEVLTLEEAFEKW